MTASPMYFSTVPPCSSSTARMTSKYRVKTSRSDSESSCSPRFVDPLRSEKTIETVFLTSWTGSEIARGVPQYPQSLNRSGFSSPQFVQTTM